MRRVQFTESQKLRIRLLIVQERVPIHLVAVRFGCSTKGIYGALGYRAKEPKSIRTLRQQSLPEVA